MFELSRHDPINQIQVRAGEPADEPFLWEMLYLAIYVPPGQSPPPRSLLRDPRIARYVRHWGTQRGDRCLLAIRQGVPIGAAWLRFFTADEPGYGFVDESTPELSIAIIPEYRGKGIGSRLLELLLGHTSSVSLSCDPANPAWALYLRAGFQPLADSRTMLRRQSPIRSGPYTSTRS